jgi:hypothetical protein
MQLDAGPPPRTLHFSVAFSAALGANGIGPLTREPGCRLKIETDSLYTIDWGFFNSIHNIYNLAGLGFDDPRNFRGQGLGICFHKGIEFLPLRAERLCTGSN